MYFKIATLVFTTFSGVLSGCNSTVVNSPGMAQETNKEVKSTWQSRRFDRWVPSCGSKFKKFANNSFEFTVEKGSVGGCPSDKLPTPQGDAQWSERAEVTTDEMRLPDGRYYWTATVEINRPCKPSKRVDFFQIHDGGTEGGPPSQLGIEKTDTFKTNQHYETSKTVPNRPFDVFADIHINGDNVTVSYAIDGKHFRTTKARRETGTDKMYVKFGIYRINSNCTATITHSNVRLVKVD